MLLTTFLSKNYDWAQEPHLYCVLQTPQSLAQPAYRCGAAGTQLFKDADLPFRASEGSQKGLAGRMTQYNNYWLPNVGRIFACLRIRKQLVALPHQRTAGDPGAQYNVDRGNQTEFLARESHYHHFLDQVGLRWQKDRNNELFQPTRGPIQIVESLRKVQGLQLLLFDEDDWREDTLYKGGDAKEPTVVRETKQRQVPTRADKDQSLVIPSGHTCVTQPTVHTSHSHFTFTLHIHTSHSHFTFTFTLHIHTSHSHFTLHGRSDLVPPVGHTCVP
jgi:hypothetical protein